MDDPRLPDGFDGLPPIDEPPEQRAGTLYALYEQVLGIARETHSFGVYAFAMAVHNGIVLAQIQREVEECGEFTRDRFAVLIDNAQADEP
jgi:hypothetical protein